MNREDKHEDPRVEYALDRTIMAAERTLMAWVRTSLSMISFGFGLFKFFQYLHQSEHLRNSLHGPRNLGLSLIALGGLLLAVASWQHVRTLEALKPGSARKSLALYAAVGLALIGVVAFAATLMGRWPF